MDFQASPHTTAKTYVLTAFKSEAVSKYTPKAAAKAPTNISTGIRPEPNTAGNDVPVIFATTKNSSPPIAPAAKTAPRGTRFSD